MKRTKVAIVINDFLVGGAQKLTAELLSRMDRSRFDITLITLFDFSDRDTLYGLVPSDVTVHRFDFSGFIDIANWYRLARVIMRERPQVVLSHLFFSNTIVRILGLFCGYRGVAVEHNTYVGKTRMQVLCDRLLSHVTERIVAVSPEVKEFTARQEGIDPSKFVVIENGVDAGALAARAAHADPSSIRQELGIPQEHRLLVSVGRMTGQKNYPLMIAGFSRFAAAHPDYDLLILGDGGLRTDIAEEAQRSPYASRVHLLGNRADVAPYLAASDWFVSTSTIEGLSMAHLEALACGVPLIATRTAGSKALISPERNGYFIAKDSPAGVSEALERAIRSDLAALRAGARETAASFSIERTVERYEHVLQEAATGRASRT
jgi:glycosyltransferase involved in cell wall biosynthesis